MNITKLDRAALKSYFVKNAVPTASNFADLIEGAAVGTAFVFDYGVAENIFAQGFIIFFEFRFGFFVVGG